MKLSKQLAGLDVIRFAAALAVIAYHLGFGIWAILYRRAPTTSVDMNYHWLAPFTWFGWIGVEIFFVLSGFVIAYSAESASALVFARGRFIRLYPTAWICSTLTLLVLLASGKKASHSMFGDWLRSFLLDPNGPWIDGSYWTLGVELGFYIVIFLLLWRGLFHHIGPVMGTVGIVSSAASILYWTLLVKSINTHGAIWFMGHYNNWRFSFILVKHGCFFAIGTLLWLYLFRGATRGRVVAIVLCVIGGLFEIVVHCYEINADSVSNFSPLVPSLVWLLTLLAIIASVKYKVGIHRLLGTRGDRLSRSLGLMTYPLYLIHQKVGIVLIYLGKGRIPDLALLAITVVILLCLSYFIAAYLDRPLQRHLRTLLGVPVRAAH